MSMGPLAIALLFAAAMMALAWALAQIGAQALTRHRRDFTQDAHVRLRELFLFIDARHVYGASAALMLFTAAVSWSLTGSALLGAALAVCSSFAPVLTLRTLRKRRWRQLEKQLPDALQVLAGGLRAGTSLTAAIVLLVREAEAPIAQEFDLLLREQRIGVALDQALENMNRRLPLPSLTLVVSALRIASATGGGLAETLERAAHTLRNTLAMEDKIRALTAQGKLQAIVVGALPLLLVFVLAQMEPEAMSLLWNTRIGWATITIVVLLETFGIVLIRKIVAIDV
jgi:tight adherence protein B